MTGWLAVVTVGVATVLLKGLGPVVLGGHPLPEALTRVLPYLSPAMLAGLVATTAFTADRALVVDARAAGVAVAAVAVLLRRSVVEVVVLAAVATAATRWLVGG